MLVLSLGDQEKTVDLIYDGQRIASVTLLENKQSQLRLGIEAGKSIEVNRSKITKRKYGENMPLIELADCLVEL